MKRKLYSLLSVIFVLSFKLVGQSVTIDPSAGAGSNIIQANSANKALKLPSIAGTSNIGSPQAGQMIYNQSTASPNYYNGTGWQNLGGAPVPSNIFPNTKYFGNPDSAPYTGTGAFLDSYQWVVPTGVSKIWIELWGGGGSGSKIENNFSIQSVGGESGSYISCIINVQAGEVFNIYPAKGREQTDVTSHIPSSIYKTIVPIVELTNSSFIVNNSVSILNFQQSTKGSHEKVTNFAVQPDYSSFYFVTGCEGGDAPFGGKGGQSSTIKEYLSPNGSSVYRSNYYNYYSNINGNFPGGGGGRGYYGGGKGGNGLAIFHW